jgi:hypothetical protein
MAGIESDVNDQQACHIDVDHLQLQSRIAVRSSRSVLTTAPRPMPSKSRVPYKSYSIESLEKAYNEVMAKKMSIRRAAEEYGVPRTTLQDRVSGKIPLHANRGHRRLLTDPEEKALANIIVGCAFIGFAKSRQDILAIVQRILQTKGVTSAPVTHGWWYSFKKRHPHITLRQAEPLAYARAAATNPEIIAKYFDLLEETLKDNDLLTKPAQIFNCDDSGMALNHKPAKVAAAVGQKHPYAVTSGDKSQITVLTCGNAAGYTIPPMVIFDRKTLKLDMTTGEVPGTFYGLSNNGWIDSELFLEWFQQHFLRYVPAARPLLLLLDGHSSHYQPDFIKLAAKEGIIVFCLPPHTTHILQPLDKVAFGSLKRHWNRECQVFCAENPGKVVNRYNFSKIFCKAWIQGMSMHNLIASFKAAGIYPVDRSVIMNKVEGEDNNSDEPATPIPTFVPFLTPSRQRHGTSSKSPSLAMQEHLQQSTQLSWEQQPWA